MAPLVLEKTGSLLCICLLTIIEFYNVLFAGSLGDNKKKEPQNIIFLHGFLSSSSFWTETVFPNLSETTEQNYRLFAVDLLGFGRSPKPRDCFYTLKDHVEAIENSLISTYQLNSFHIVAHSMGCVIALALAAKYSKTVKSVVLIAPVSILPKPFFFLSLFFWILFIVLIVLMLFFSWILAILLFWRREC